MHDYCDECGMAMGCPLDDPPRYPRKLILELLRERYERIGW